MSSTWLRAGIAMAALLAMPLSPRAADVAGPIYRAPAYMAVSSWSGFYLGLNGGYGLGKSRWDIPNISPVPTGALIGATLGYNFRHGSVVYGVEGDGDWSWMRDSINCATSLCRTQNDWLGTARGRIGYAFNNFLPFVTAGVGAGNVKATNWNLGTSASHTNFGLAAGAGLEYALMSNWSAKFEYLYVDLGKVNCGFACGTAGDNVSLKGNILRAGVNYRF